MWRQFTREHPARPGWAIAGAALALAATTALAWFLSARSANASSLAGRQTPPYWPLSFQLPDEYTWTPDLESRLSFTDPDADEGSLTLRGRSFTRGHATLVVHFKIWAFGGRLLELAQTLTGEDFSDTPIIKIGSARGRLLILTRPPDSWSAIAAARTDDGLLVFINYFSSSGEPDELEIIDRLCQSIEFRHVTLPTIRGNDDAPGTSRRNRD